MCDDTVPTKHQAKRHAWCATHLCKRKVLSVGKGALPAAGRVSTAIPIQTECAVICASTSWERKHHAHVGVRSDAWRAMLQQCSRTCSRNVTEETAPRGGIAPRSSSGCEGVGNRQVRVREQTQQEQRRPLEQFGPSEYLPEAVHHTQTRRPCFPR